MKKRFKDLKTISLRNNYRSAREIIELSQNLIKGVPEEERTGEKPLIALRDFKTKSIECWEFTTKEEEMCFLVDKVKELKEQIHSSKDLSLEERRAPYNNIAILVRKRALILRIIDKFLHS
ncbi:MAG: 3'-5' exonuclease, partial [Candidatus Omnitrophota bacterium]